MINTIIIDDEYWILEGLKHTIDWEDNGFKIIGAFTNLNSASDFVLSNQNKIDLIITDIRLGNRSGLDFIREIKPILKPDTVYMVMSAYQDFQYAKQAIKLGVFSYIEKPIEGSELLSTLSELKNRLFSNAPADEQADLNESPKNTVLKILDYSSKNYSDPCFSLSTVSEHFHLSHKYLSSIFKKHTGENFTTYIRNLKIEKSKELLANTSKSLKDIAVSCGFTDYYYFSKVFKQTVGISPTDYRKEQNKTDTP